MRSLKQNEHHAKKYPSMMFKNWDLRVRKLERICVNSIKAYKARDKNKTKLSIVTDIFTNDNPISERMPMKPVAGEGLGVVAGDVLALRGTGLAASETWALLCQAAQALQDLFLSNGGVVGDSRSGPVVTPHTLELTSRGRVMLLQASPDTARAYLPPEYRPGRIYSDTDSEKMWMYSLGRALLDTTPRVTALTGTVSVSPSSALQSVLAAMTEPDPRRRASLMNLLDVISEYCRTRLQSRSFIHIVMDMYREVVRSTQYAARKRAILQPTKTEMDMTIKQHLHHQQQQHPLGANAVPLRQNPPPFMQQMLQQQHSRHRGKGAVFRAHLRNSRSQPNLLSMSNSDGRHGSRTNVEDGSYGYIIGTRPFYQHVRTNSQPECCMERGTGMKIPQVRSSSNLAAMTTVSSSDARNAKNPFYGEPLYTMPVKPFLSSQDVSKANASARQFERAEVRAPFQVVAISHNQAKDPKKLETQSSLPHLDNDLSPGQILPMTKLQRQHSSPQFSSTRCSREKKLWEFANSLPDSSDKVVRAQNAESNIDIREREQHHQQNLKQLEQNANFEGRIPYVPRGPAPPKPPRIITNLKKAAAAQAALDAQVRNIAKPERDMRNGPRARKGRAVQRAPSRLYRALNGSAPSFNKTQCVGPEFVVRANQPAKLLTVGDFKVNKIGRLTVILLNGQRLEVTCDPQKITAGELFQAIVQAEGIEENFTLGLAVLLAGDFSILPSDTKLNKVAPPGWLNSGKTKGLLGLPTSFMLYLRLRFFLPSLRGIRGWISKHLIYLQIRRCILEQQLICPLTQLINLTGLALQAEFGNYNINEHGCGDYFLLEHYVPESLILNPEEQQYRHPQLPDSGEELRKRLQHAHKERRGLDANKAEEMFVIHAQSLIDYGAHYYIATVETKELRKLVARQKKSANENHQIDEQPYQQNFYDESENIYDIDKLSDYPLYGKIDFHNPNKHEQNVERSLYTDEQKIMLSKSPSNITHESCASQNKSLESENNNNNKTANKTNKFKKNESDVWLAIHSKGLKIFERGARLRERLELAKFQWKDIQTLSYGKSCLVIYSRINGKRCKFKLKMNHRKSYYAFKLTSLHHQFFLKLRSELTSLQGLIKEFGVELTVNPNSQSLKMKTDSTKTKISIADSVKKQQEYKLKYRTRLEEEQNKENENPLKAQEGRKSSSCKMTDPSVNADESNKLYAQVNARLEPEGESRDTEDEAERALIISENILSSPNINTYEVYDQTKSDRLYNYVNIAIPYGSNKEEYIYTIPKPYSTNDIDRINEKIEIPEDLYTAINKSGFRKKTKPQGQIAENWKEIEIQKTLDMVKTSSLPNCVAIQQNENQDSLNTQGKLDDNEETYSRIGQNESKITDALEIAPINLTSVKSTESPIPEAYVLNADIRTAEETFRIPDETMSTSLMARLDELSFDEERMLRTVKLERGQGGSIGLQVTEGNDGGVYVQAVSVGGSADMAGNVNKGDRIVAINGQSLLNFRYEDALKMLQSSSESVELVLSQIVLINNTDDEADRHTENNYLHNIRFNVSTETDTEVMSSKWLQKTIDVVSVQNTSSAYSSAASSAMGNHNTNSLYVPDIDETNGINSASILLSLEDFDINESMLPPPPVPPRRRKCKIEPKRIYIANEIKPERKYREISSLPQPIVPQRLRTGKKPLPLISNKINLLTIKTANNNFYCECRDDDEIPNVNKHKCKNVQVHEIEDTESEEKKEGKIEVKQTTIKEYFELEKSNKCQSYIPFSNTPKPDEYQSLYFTLEDYQQVMDESINQSNLIVQEESEAVNQNKKCDDSPNIKSVLYNNEREEFYFHVSTTNEPFQNCFEKFSNLNVDVDDECKDDDRTDLYIFENYVDRSNRLNERPSLIFDKSYDTQIDEMYSSKKSASKVRFVFETPIASIDSYFDNNMDYGNCINNSLDKHTQSAQLVDISDEQHNENQINMSNIYEKFNNIVNNKNNFSILKINNPIDSEIDSSKVFIDTNNANKINSEYEEINIYNNSLKNKDYNFVWHKENISSNKEELIDKDYIFSKSSFQISSNNDNKNVNLSNEWVDEKVSNEDNCVKISENVKQKEQSLHNFIKDKFDVKENLNESLSVYKKSVPVSLQRNTFLEAMLSENQLYLNSSHILSSNCEIIATHFKENLSVPINEKQSTKVEKNSEHTIPLVDISPKPQILNKINQNEYNKKSVDIIKRDVLNELMTNFNTIKLKSVNTNNHKKFYSNKYDTIEDKISEVKNDNINKMKQEGMNLKEVHTANLQDTLKLGLLVIEKANIDINVINKNTCAIVTKTAFAHSNANDNKIMTPIVLSNDQNCEVLITPGSVKNFIKYYEIHNEISSISKIRDNTYKKQKQEYIGKDIRVNDTKKPIEPGDNMKCISKCSETSKTEILITKNERNNITDKSNKVYNEYFPIFSNSLDHVILNKSCVKSLIVNPEIERRKSVQFHSECMVIEPFQEHKKKVMDDMELINETETRLKRKAPEKPIVQSIEQPKELMIKQQYTESSPVIYIQKAPEVEVTCTSKPDNRSLFPKVKTLQNNQTIVFYCNI